MDPTRGSVDSARGGWTGLALPSSRLGQFPRILRRGWTLLAAGWTLLAGVDPARVYALLAIAGRDGRKMTPRSPMPMLASGYAAQASSRADVKSRRKSRSLP
jgi:hypothetical protein